MIKQTTKTSKKSANDNDPILDREEQPSTISHFAFNPFAIKPASLRDQILDELTAVPVFPLFMVSQRQRILYMPEGNHNILIELGLEPIHYGQTFCGERWGSPKIDIELKRVPDGFSTKQRHSLLIAERERLMERFNLTPVLRSSPSEGFDILANKVGTKGFSASFEDKSVTEPWWLNLKAV